MTFARNRIPNKSLVFGIFIVSILLVFALYGTLMKPQIGNNLAFAFQAPSRTHLFGCDAFGNDLSVEVLLGAHQSLKVATEVTALNLIVGLLVGTAMAIARPPVTFVLSSIVDIFLSFPGLLLAILLASIMPHSEKTVVFALVVTGWTGRARFCRALAQDLLRSPFIEAAFATGASSSRIILKHLWPSMTGHLTVQCALSMGSVILGEASLSFLGLGGSSSNSSWGRLIADGREYLVEAPHLSLIPGAIFVLTVFGFNILAEGLRQRLDTSQDWQ